LRQPLLAIVGPTAAGKTRLAVALAHRFKGEIINADSRQVYRGMDIGTAKPTPQELQQASHHLINILDPYHDFALGAFLPLAREALDDMRSRGRLPLLVGGTGQYVWALLEGWDVPQVPPDPEFRRAREQEAQEAGEAALYRKLQQIDPQRAGELDPRNVRRVIRALEIYHVTGRPPSHFRRRTTPPEHPLVLGLTMAREELYRRIDRRVDLMMDQGFLDEVRTLAARGYRLGRGALASPGYRELGHYLEGEISLVEAVQRTKFQTHRLARRQYAWFRLNDPRISWLPADSPDLEGRAAGLLNDFLSQSRPMLQ
jgi:tRNA dimethylallyltransferase